MAKIILSGEVGVEISLYGVLAEIQRLRKEEAITQLDIDITSIGGDSEQGRQIYEYLKSLEFPVNMNAVDYVCSAGLTIFCAGQKRTAENKDVEFLMHSPKFAPSFWDAMFGLTAQEIEQIKKDVEQEKKILSEIYSESFGLEKSIVETLMDRDEIITAETAKGIGMIQSIVSDTVITPITFNYKVAAKYFINKSERELTIKLNTNMENVELTKLSEEVKTQGGLLASIKAGLDKLFKTEVKALSLATDEGTQLEIVGDVLEVGVAVTNVEEGTFTVIYNDLRYTVVIAGSVVESMTEIEVGAEDMEAIKTENDALKQKVADLEAQIQSAEALKNQIEAQKKDIETLSNITSRYKKEDGTYEFISKVTTAKELTREEMLEKHVQERKAKRNK